MGRSGSQQARFNANHPDYSCDLRRNAARSCVFPRPFRQNWEKVGNLREFFSALYFPLYIVLFSGPGTTKAKFFSKLDRESRFMGLDGDKFSVTPLKILLISMFSHGIPNTSDEDEADGALNDPKKSKTGFIQATTLHQTLRSGARASRHPPRWRAQLDTPRGGTRAAG